jgi:hypothetical protein
VSWSFFCSSGFLKWEETTLTHYFSFSFFFFFSLSLSLNLSSLVKKAEADVKKGWFGFKKEATAVVKDAEAAAEKEVSRSWGIFRSKTDDATAAAKAAAKDAVKDAEAAAKGAVDDAAKQAKGWFR